MNQGKYEWWFIFKTHRYDKIGIWYILYTVYQKNKSVNENTFTLNLNWSIKKVQPFLVQFKMGKW